MQTTLYSLKQNLSSFISSHHCGFSCVVDFVSHDALILPVPFLTAAQMPPYYSCNHSTGFKVVCCGVESVSSLRGEAPVWSTVFLSVARSDTSLQNRGAQPKIFP